METVSPIAPPSIDKEILMNEFQEYLAKIETIFRLKTEELQETEQRFQAIIEQAADAIIIVNEQLKILSWNEGAQDVFGYQAREALGRGIDELVTGPEVVEQIRQLSAKILSGEKIRAFETIRYAKGGVPKNVIISGTPVKNKAGKITTICLIYKDITEFKQAQAKLFQAEKQATLEIIAGSIGHELNNLVSGLFLFARLLTKNPEDVKQVAEVSDIIYEQLTTISLHAKNLLTLSKPERPLIKNVDLIELLETTTTTLVLSGILKRFKLVKNFPASLPLIRADQHLLEQAIRNLEINAAHALGSNGVLTIGAQVAADPRFVEFYIADNGTGIPEAIQEKIFEPFFTTKAEGKGTGLGLPIVKQIVEHHHGYLKLTSKPGVGTTITIGIPVANQTNFETTFAGLS